MLEILAIEHEHIRRYFEPNDTLRYTHVEQFREKQDSCLF